MVSDLTLAITNMLGDLLSYAFIMYDKVGALPLMFGAFMIFTIYKFILQPILGGGGSSDTASKKVTQKNSED